MIISSDVLQINKGDGFSKDIFDREAMADGITNIFLKTKVPLVVAIDAPWGFGKTTFVNMWADKLRTNGFPVLYFDAFENDYTSDPFFSIASEILSISESSQNLVESAAENFKQKTIKLGTILLKRSLRAAIKIGTAGIVDDSILEAASDEIVEAGNDTVDSFIAGEIEGNLKRREAVLEFKRSLHEIASQLGAGEKPLVFFIDELDRCRPSFALDIIEIMKHFFAVDNVHFVLVANYHQIHGQLRAIYGPDLDANGYVEKFISFRVSLNDVFVSTNGKMVRFINHLIKKFELSEYTGIQIVQNCLLGYLEVKHPSLRTLEKIFTYIALSVKYKNLDSIPYPGILTILCILKVKNPALYDRAKNGSLEYMDLATAVGFEYSTDKKYIQISKWWNYLFLSEERLKDLSTSQIRDMTFGFSTDYIDRTEFLQHVIDNVVDIFLLGK